MDPIYKICAASDCSKEFQQYNSLDKYCSYSCKAKNQKQHSKKKIQKPIPKISKKQQTMLQKYMKIRKQFLSYPENQYCPVTGNKATEIHHKMGKIGFADQWARQFNVPLLIDERYFLAVSRPGHQRIELNPEWAIKNHYSEKRNTNETTRQIN